MVGGAMMIGYAGTQIGSESCLRLPPRWWRATPAQVTHRVSSMRTSRFNGRNKYILRLFGGPFLIALALCAILILIGHFRLGAMSPGVVILAKNSLSYWTPLVMILFLSCRSFGHYFSCAR